MAALTIRNLDDDVKAKLRIRAAHNGRSMEAEVREILAEAVDEAESADAMLEVAESTNIPTAASYDPDSDMTDEEYARVQQFLAELPEIEDFARDRAGYSASDRNAPDSRLQWFRMGR